MAIFLPLTFNVGAANAQTASYSIETVTHNVQILNSGHMVISDIIVLSGQSPSSFQIGFPYTYAQYVLEGIAYDSTGKELPIALGVELEDQPGFYAATVDLTGTSSKNFTVAFTFASGLLTSVTDGFDFDFPAYPSFTQTAEVCTTNIVLPSSNTAIVGIDKPDGVVNSTTYSKSNLAAFSSASATGTFSQVGSAIQLIDINSITSQVTYGPTGDITRTDTYNITCKQLLSVFFPFPVPSTATNIVVRDQFGSQLSFSTITDIYDVTVANTTFSLGLSQNQSTLLTLSYDLPKSTTVGDVSSTLFSVANCYVQRASVTYVLPEGAQFTSPTTSSQGYTLSRDVFQQSLTVSKTGVSFIDSNVPTESTIHFTYDYNYLWIAFRPSLWAVAIAFVGIIVFAVVKRPKAPAGRVVLRPVISRPISGGSSLSSEQIQQFVEACEEKNKVTKEIRTLEARAEHGRIPRRRYKVQRKTLEGRLEALSHKAATLKESVRSAGGSYADIVRQLDAAEVELNEVEMTIKNAGVRHETGELSLENYRKQLADLERRKEKAETTVNGLLLRLRGEIR